MTDFKLIGRLDLDAPGIVRDLRRTYPAKVLPFLASAYRESAALGGLREPYISREAGVSYNPRPARLVQILLKETSSLTALNCASAMLFCIADEYINLIHRQFNSCLLTIEHLYDLKASSSSEKNIFFASLLDKVRHLHQSPENNSVRAASLKSYESDVHKWIRDIESIENKQILLKIKHAIELQSINLLK